MTFSVLEAKNLSSASAPHTFYLCQQLPARRRGALSSLRSIRSKSEAWIALPPFDDVGARTGFSRQSREPS
jgi:hypothetical protein